MLHVGQPRNLQDSWQGEDFSHLYNVQSRSRTPTSLLYNKQWWSFTRVEQMGSKADHPPQSTAEAKNKWCYTSTTYLHCIHRNFTAHHMPSLCAQGLSFI